MGVKHPELASISLASSEGIHSASPHAGPRRLEPYLAVVDGELPTVSLQQQTKAVRVIDLRSGLRACSATLRCLKLHAAVHGRRSVVYSSFTINNLLVCPDEIDPFMLPFIQKQIHSKFPRRRISNAEHLLHDTLYNNKTLAVKVHYNLLSQFFDKSTTDDLLFPSQKVPLKIIKPMERLLATKISNKHTHLVYQRYDIR